MERMVTLADLERWPELRLKGVSLNQHYDFTVLEQEDADNQYQRPMQPPPLKQQSIKVPEGTVTTIHVPKPVPVQKKEVPVKKEAKKEAVVKPVPVKSVKEVPAKKPAKVIPVKKAVVKKEAPKKAAKKWGKL